ncbi:MAG TPA: hypothetical protein VMF70_12880 [Gemmatimonadales bacterium]|nr:hypothetical protein [Gemmatimonadales bacterium]
MVYRPEGTGPFAAVVLSHGRGSSAADFGSLIAPTFVSRGLVCIGVNYTLASGVRLGTIRTPYQTHHGDADSTVALSFELRLDSLFTALGVEHVLYVYPGLGHNDVRWLPLVLQRVHDRYAAHGMF